MSLMDKNSEILISGLNNLFMDFTKEQLQETLDRMLLLNVDTTEVLLCPNMELLNLGVKSLYLKIKNSRGRCFFGYTLNCDTRVLNYDVIKDGALVGSIGGKGLLPNLVIIRVNIIKIYDNEKLDINIVNLLLSQFIHLETRLIPSDFKEFDTLDIYISNETKLYYTNENKSLRDNLQCITEDVLKHKRINFWMSCETHSFYTRKAMSCVEYMLEELLIYANSSLADTVYLYYYQHTNMNADKTFNPYSEVDYMMKMLDVDARLTATPKCILVLDESMKSAVSIYVMQSFLMYFKKVIYKSNLQYNINKMRLSIGYTDHIRL